MRRIFAVMDQHGRVDETATTVEYLRACAHEHLTLAAAAAKDPRSAKPREDSYMAAGILLLASVFAQDEHQPLLLAEILSPIAQPVVVDRNGRAEAEPILSLAVEAIRNETPSRYLAGDA